MEAIERWSGGCGEVFWRLWRFGLADVEWLSRECGEVVWRLW